MPSFQVLKYFFTFAKGVIYKGSQDSKVKKHILMAIFMISITLNLCLLPGSVSIFKQLQDMKKTNVKLSEVNQSVTKELEAQIKTCVPGKQKPPEVLEKLEPQEPAKELSCPAPSVIYKPVPAKKPHYAINQKTVDELNNKFKESK